MIYPNLDAAIVAKLTAHAPLTALIGSPQRLYSTQAPAAATYPLVVYYPADVRLLNETPRNTISAVYRFDAWVQSTSTLDAHNIIVAIFGALHQKILTITGFRTCWLAFENQQNFAELVSGVQYRRRVASYRLIVDEETVV